MAKEQPKPHATVDIPEVVVKGVVWTRATTKPQNRTRPQPSPGNQHMPAPAQE